MLDNNLPQHIALIMDGNRRWAKQHHLSTLKGHQQGRQALKEIVKHSAQIGIKTLTAFAMSSENIHRSRSEINALFNLFLRALKEEAKELQKAEVRLRIIGDLSVFNHRDRAFIDRIQQQLASCHGLELIIALNYGGRWDILQAMEQTVRFAQDNMLDQDTTRTFFEQHLSLAGAPHVDLLIRTSGEQRISNFLLWDIAYSELYFSETLWPDFTPAELDKAIANYQARHRRFGLRKHAKKSQANKQ